MISPSPRRLSRGLLPWMLVVAAGCQGLRGVEEVPLADDRIGPRDRFLDVSTSDGERVVVVGYGGKILTSDDGGESWRRAASPPPEKALLRVAFADDRAGWIVGQDGLVLHTGDGGRSWRAQESGVDDHLFGVAAPSPERVFACGDRSRWLETDDGGATWRASTVPLSDLGLRPEIALALEEPIYYDVHFLDELTGWVVGDYGNIRFTENGGRTWSDQHGSILGQKPPGTIEAFRDALDLPALFRIEMRDRQSGLVAGVGGLLFETTDGGATWALVPLDPDFTGNAPLVGIGLTPSGAVLTGGSGVAFELVGADWRPVDLGLPRLTWIAAVDFADRGPRAGRRGFAVGGRGVILRTDDSGRSWAPLGTLAGGAG